MNQPSLDLASFIAAIFAVFIAPPLALLSAGLLDDAELVIAAAGREAQLEWEYAAVVDRSNPAVAAVQQQEALTDAQIDDLFREAAKL